MISRSEIKKCGWKPVEDHKSDYKYYALAHTGKHYRLTHLDEEEGKVLIERVEPMAEEMNLMLFFGKLPARYELQIIMRCLEIG